MIFRNKARSALLASAAISALAAPIAVEAQQTTSAIQGMVTTPENKAATGVTVRITDSRTGTNRVVTTNETGSFNIRNLSIGGPYSISFSAEGFENKTITDIFLSASSLKRLDFTLTAKGAQSDYVEEITIKASTATFGFTALGPSSSFTKAEIRNLPSISRDVNDIIRLDPRVQFQGGGVSCLGSNNNFNAFTIDGVRAGDGFGLNGTGNLGRNTFPIPFDALGEANVEFAPVDVQYGLFRGCQINVISQKGTNEFSGSAFFLYNSDALRGSEISGQPDVEADFDRFNWGADLGGPIIEDKLFFYVAYEEFTNAAIQDEGPAFAGFSRALDTTVSGNPITQNDLDRFSSILEDSYGRDPALLTLGRTLPLTNRRFFGRIDWNINDNHRLEASYARLDELSERADGLGNDVFTFRDSFSTEGTNSDAFSLRLFSDWTDNLSTEVRVSRQSVTDNQDPLGGGEAQDANIPRISVALTEDFLSLNPFFGQGLTSGPGIFRSANQLDYTTDQVRLKADYVAGDHLFTVGYELDSLEVFNLFIIDATGTIFFDGLDSLEAGNASGFSFNGTFTGDVNDAAASFTRDIHTLYVQDKWQVNDRLELIAGLRYDWYDSADSPIENPVFVQRYGFTNTQSFAGLDVVMPRFGLNYDAPEEIFGDTTFSAGAGVFSVAGPTVWFANSFQNFGGAIGSANTSNCDAADLQVLNNGQFTGIPQCLRDAASVSALQNTGRADAVDPNFQIPSQVRLNISADHTTDFGGNGFFDGWNIRTDVIYSVLQNGVDFVDLTLSPLLGADGLPETTPDGRVRQQAIDPLLAGCNAVFVGPRIGFTNVTPECNAGGDDQDILLTNVDGSGGRTINASIQLSKSFTLGDATSLDVRGGYAFSDVTLLNTGSNATATSGFEENARFGPNQSVVGPAAFQNAHAFTLAATLEHEFFESYPTALTLFWSGREGNPYSIVFDDNTSSATFGDSDNEARILAYIPTGPNDPNVDFSGLASDEVTALFNFIDDNNLSRFAGGVVDRNSQRNPWNMDIDLRFKQDFPGFFANDRFQLFIDLENFLNFVDSGIGRQQFVDNGDVGEAVPIVRAFLNDQGQYVFTDADNRLGVNQDPLGIFTQANATLWRINLGIRYEF